jgi:hypothetical protein
MRASCDSSSENISFSIAVTGCDFISLKNDSCLASSEELAWRTRRLRTRALTGGLRRRFATCPSKHSFFGASRAFDARNSRHWTEYVTRRDTLRSRITSPSRLLGFRFRRLNLSQNFHFLCLPFYAALLSCAIIAQTQATL